MAQRLSPVEICNYLEKILHIFPHQFGQHMIDVSLQLPRDEAQLTDDLKGGGMWGKSHCRKCSMHSH